MYHSPLKVSELIEQLKKSSEDDFCIIWDGDVKHGITKVIKNEEYICLIRNKYMPVEKLLKEMVYNKQLEEMKIHLEVIHFLKGWNNEDKVKFFALLDKPLEECSTSKIIKDLEKVGIPYQYWGELFKYMEENKNKVKRYLIGSELMSTEDIMGKYGLSEEIVEKFLIWLNAETNKEIMTKISPEKTKEFFTLLL